MKLGIDVLLADRSLQKELKGRRLALLGHPASMTSMFEHSLDALMQTSDLKLSAAFGPQHGMRGEKQDNMIETVDYMDPVYKIPVFSLYGESRRPTASMLSHCDVILIDLQDVGTRIYTFLTTLLYVLEESAKHGKSVWVLDRPNPAGRVVEGSVLEKGWVSFVGAAEGLPMRHGLTLAEAALWFVKTLNISVDLKIVPMQGYAVEQEPGCGWPVELPWVNPSPNAATLNMARCFPGTVLLEGTTLSEARGTTHPLEMMGAPDIDMSAILNKMRAMAPQWLNGCRLRSCYFQPTFQKHAGKMCAGFQVHAEFPFYRHQEFKPYRLVALFLKAVRQIHPDYPIWRDFHYEYEKERLAFDLINGGPCLREWIDNSSGQVGDIEKRLLSEEQAWRECTRQFKLYS